MEPPLLAGASRLSRTLDARSQILAGRCANRQRLRRSKSVLLLSADRRIRESLKDFSQLARIEKECCEEFSSWLSRSCCSPAEFIFTRITIGIRYRPEPR